MLEQRAALALPVSTAAVTALLVLAARQQALLAQPSTMAVLAQSDLPAVAAVAVVRLVGLGPVTTVASHLAAAAMQEPVALVEVAALLAVQAVSMVRAMVLVAAAVVILLPAGVMDLLAACTVLLAAVHAAFLKQAVLVFRALSSSHTPRPPAS